MRTTPLALVAVAVPFLAGSCPGSAGRPATPAARQATDAAAPPRHDARPAEAPTGPGVRLLVEPASASITIDGRTLGAASDFAGGFVPLAPGLHQITIRADGFETWRAEVMVREQAEVLQVRLGADRKP